MEFKSSFKWKMRYFALQKFRIKMLQAQNSWNAMHNPIEILERNKAQYVNVIKERLKNGFTFHGDGNIAGNVLVNAIYQKAKKAGDSQKIEDVLGIGWLTNSESVRLKYFSELAEKVNKNKLWEALEHFRNPQYRIEEWFRNEVNKFSTGNEFKTFRDTYASQLDRVITDVQNLSTISDIRKYIEEFIIQCESINFPKGLDSSKASKTDLDIFIKSIVDVLNKGCDTLKDPTFIIPSNDDLVMRRLGCTYSCLLCSALCWGQRGHDEDDGANRKHHTCHQPMGLAGVHYKYSGILIFPACNDQADSDEWIEENKDMKWGEMKVLKNYENWMFESHVNIKFNDLMKWFFYKLNKSIAQDRELKPTPDDELEKNGFNSIDYGLIIATMRGKF
jgi:hypothetical protein